MRGSTASGPMDRVTIAGLLLMAALAAAPVVFEAIDEPFYLDLVTRLVIISIAAASLNLILGYGGMVSFGHAAFVGIGAYAVGVPAHHDEYGGILHAAIAVAASSLFALATGAISLRAKGVHFIMITMAFAQMAFFLFVSIEEYGGDDGLLIHRRSEIPGLDLEDGITFYYVCYLSLCACLFLIHRVVHSRFGRVIAGARSNERRMRSLGFPTYRYRLVCYAISGAMCGFAGVLLGNFTNFISPEMMDWTRSGELIFQVVLGGAASLFGPVFGVTAFVAIEEFLDPLMDAIWPGSGIYWHLVFGVLLVVVVLFARGGISGMLSGRQPE